MFKYGPAKYHVNIAAKLPQVPGASGSLPIPKTDAIHSAAPHFIALVFQSKNRLMTVRFVYK